MKRNPRYEYSSVEDAYKKLFNELNSFARKNLIEPDHSIDAINDAFIKVLEWQNKKKTGHVSAKIIYRLVLKACRKYNRRQRMVSIHDPAFAAYFRTEIGGPTNSEKN